MDKIGGGDEGSHLLLACWSTRWSIKAFLFFVPSRCCRSLESKTWNEMIMKMKNNNLFLLPPPPSEQWIKVEAVKVLHQSNRQQHVTHSK